LVAFFVFWGVVLREKSRSLTRKQRGFGMTDSCGCGNAEQRSSMVGGSKEKAPASEGGRYKG